ncbi:substrate-binding domain-containing protein [Actinoallomurus purpureus]|uniref:substrate-binding domain-containing protein n=1 Tax=Actinoallomurus purpureus TaxID=478114 RepID=UPI0020933706|nr:substrate-binding domain-containing protein [Actinoallomurus purpureus]MCO6004209.1 substrate-binding domain-containing protein [Actinoallomurus purpureus]
MTNADMSRRTMVGGAALGMLGSLAACASEKKPDASKGGEHLQRGKKVIFVAHDRSPFFEPIKAGFLNAGRMLGWQTQFTGPPALDIQKTVELQQSAINARPDGLILTRIDDHSFDANIERALKQNIKIVLSNVASAGREKLSLAFVGQDFGPAGELCGQQICEYAQRLGRKDGLIVLGNGDPGNSALEQRIQGMKRGIDAYNKAHGTSFAGDDFVSSFEQTQALGKIDAKYRKERDRIAGWSMSGVDHQFVAAWIKQQNIRRRFAVGGFDLVNPILEGIKGGTIDFTLGQNPYAQGWIAATLLAMELDPGYPARDYDTGAEIVSSSNIDAVIRREAGFA